MTWPQYQRRQCVVDGRHVALDGDGRGPKPRVQIEILAALLLRRGRAMPMNDLIEAVYPDPDVEPEHAKYCIKSALRALRRKLPGVILTRRGFGYVISAAGGW